MCYLQKIYVYTYMYIQQANSFIYKWERVMHKKHFYITNTFYIQKQTMLKCYIQKQTILYTK